MKFEHFAGETNVHTSGQGWGWETDQRGVAECTQLKWGAHNKVEPRLQV